MPYLMMRGRISRFGIQFRNIPIEILTSNAFAENWFYDYSQIGG